MKLRLTAGIAGAMFLAPLLAWAHAGEPLQPDDLWSIWSFDPGVVLPMALSAFLYLRGSLRQVIVSNRERVCFWAGWVMLAIALLSPLHPLGEVLFSAHMVQHEMLMLAAAPLLVLSRPLVTFLWAMPFEWRRNVGRWVKAGLVRSCWMFLTAPFAAWWIHAAAIWVWHAPFLFELTLRSELAHTAQHLSFFLSALIFWWALFFAQGRRATGLPCFTYSRRQYIPASSERFLHSLPISGTPPMRRQLRRGV